MLCFDKLEKNWKKTISTNDTDFIRLSSEQKNLDDIIKKDKSDIYNKLVNINKSLKILSEKHPVTLDEKAIYDLAETERAEIYHGKKQIEKAIAEQGIDVSTTYLLNVAFELGQNIGSYNMALGFQQYFEAGQQSAQGMLKSITIKKIKRESYFDIFQMVFSKLSDDKYFRSFSNYVAISQLDQFLQSKISNLPIIKDTMEKYIKEGLITPKKGTRTKVDKEQEHKLKTYLSDIYKSNFNYNISGLYNSTVESKSNQTSSDFALHSPIKLEVDMITCCNSLFSSIKYKAQLLKLPIQAISAGIVEKVTLSSAFNDLKIAHFKNMIQLEIKIKHSQFYKDTINITPTDIHRKSFLKVYIAAQADKTIKGF
ncbi:hypothetical protein EKO29_15830 [Colwellia sp. Arc7-635]|uniref:hypothetical protein n=1 Tax=Colwellia sp. Arc7-635 TaxID=2497879 RepID=UPI000F85696D|nr:hypothetical protein [Colwellia sp. Arc7-635]AZQ85319.1 hypothetical protein EKO29_15830 [Colwellia sp. Arc7-635]